ncbi:MAG TPA: efflux RND transporter periplasmic adaptor subunit [Bryobacteraceae bacterium]|nr:efflux RND transporter periplasmic adaptor subunit [Bryobacteraceae bacterium]
MAKTPRRLIRFFVLLVIATGGVFAVRQFRRTEAAAALPMASAKKGDFLVLVRTRGQLIARHSEQLIAPIDATDLQIVWLSPAGGPVKKDEVVIKFDPSRTQQDLKEKQVALDQAQAALDQAVADAKIAADQDQIDLSTANYTAEKAKLEAAKEAIVSKIQGEESEIDFNLAQQRLKVQQASIVTHEKSAESHIASLTRARDTAKTQVECTQHQLSLMELKSPLDGVINYMSNYSQGWINAQPFKVGDHAVAGGVLAEIPDLSTLEMEAKVDEVDRGRVAVGAQVMVHVDAFPEKTMPAAVGFITPLPEQNNEWPPTRSFRAYAKIDSPDARLRPGMNAGADIVETKIPNAISVPAKALFTRDGKPVVYVKAGEQYVAKPVQVTAKNPDEVAIKGIDAGTMVALADPTALTAGKADGKSADSGKAAKP